MSQSADPGELMRQAPWTIDTYLRSAIEAAKNFDIPAAQRATFIAAYIQACSLDYAGSIISRAIELASETIKSGLDEVAAAINQHE
jgi:hypothetical protein